MFSPAKAAEAAAKVMKARGRKCFMAALLHDMN
jgi:HD superfamily phosphohydrolase YqeK